MRIQMFKNLEEEKYYHNIQKNIIVIFLSNFEIKNNFEVYYVQNQF